MQLLDASLAFPTVVFTVLLGIVLVYWLFVILGALDLDLLSGGDAGGHDIGGHDFGGHDIGGHDIGGHDVGGHDLGGHHHDVDLGDGSHEVDSGGLVNLLRPLGLSKVPLTITLTFLILSSWAFCLLIVYYLQQAWPGGPRWLIGAIGFFGALFLSVPITALLIAPLGPMFHTEPGKTRADYLGSVCEITTGHVDDDFGQAEVKQGGDVLVIPVRNDSGKQFKRYSKALIISYDDERDAYIIEPIDEHLVLDSEDNA